MVILVIIILYYSNVSKDKWSNSKKYNNLKIYLKILQVTGENVYLKMTVIIPHFLTSYFKQINKLGNFARRGKNLIY